MDTRLKELDFKYLSAKVLHQLNDEGYIKFKSVISGKETYMFKSRHGYITKRLVEDDAILENDQPDMITNPHNSKQFVGYAQDLLEYVDLHDRLVYLVKHEPLDKDLRAKVISLAKQRDCKLSRDKLASMVRLYLSYLHTGFPFWDYKHMAELFGITAPTMRKYLKALDIYEAKRDHQVKSKG